MKKFFYLIISFLLISTAAPVFAQLDVIDPWVDAVIDYEAGDNSRGVPENLIGAPGEGDSENGEFALDDGFIIVDMGLGEEIEDGPGVDFQVLEGGDNEDYIVYAATQLDGQWIELGEGSGNHDFDLNDVGLSSVRYLRIEDRGYTSDGADLESVEAYYYPNDPWVDEVVSYDLDPEWADSLAADEKDPIAAIGPEDGRHVTLPFSTIIVRFTDNTVIDAEGEDLFIEEVGSGGESGLVSISTDGNQWTQLGVADNNTTTSFDLASIGYTQPVVFVKIEGQDAGGSSPGFDLDAVYALPNSIGAPPDPSDDPNTPVDSNDVISIYDDDFTIASTVEFPQKRPLYPDGFKPLFTENGDIVLAVSALGEEAPYDTLVYQQGNSSFVAFVTIVEASASKQILNVWASRADQIALLVGPARGMVQPESLYYLVRINGPFGFTGVSNFSLY